MSYVHTAQFSSRHYECDAQGLVHYANYLRYMQEAAFDASAAVGYSAQRYAEIGYHWFAYETDLSIHEPLHYGDALTIRTWVHDFRRVRSLRYYQLYRDDTLIGQAATDWVFIEVATGRPVSIPQTIIDAYSRGEHVEAAPKRKLLPPAPMPPPEADLFSLQRQVTWRDVDPAGHVNNAVYLDYVMDCHKQMNPEAPAFSQVQLEYKLPAQWGDLITVRAWQQGDVWHYAIQRDQQVLVRVRAAV